MTRDLVAWLRMQLDQDERWAQAASQVPIGEHWHWVCTNCDTPLPITDVTVLDEYLECPNCEGRDLLYQVALRSVEEYPTESVGPLPHFVVYATDEQTPVTAAHIVRHDPARVLAEVEAKRLQLDLHRGCAASCYIVRMLALPYTDQPGYQEAWRP